MADVASLNGSSSYRPVRPRPAHLVPACDRCGHSTDLDDLVPDDLGPVCPDCRAGGQPTTQEARRGA